MTRNYTTNSITLNSYDFSENDKIIVMYSKEKGLLKGIAKGCKKAKSKLGATMQALVANRIIMNKGRNLDIISQAEAVESFKDLKKDFNKLSISMYFAEIVSNYGVEDDINSKEIYDLLYKSFETVSKSNNLVELLICALKFQLKIMNVLGFRLSLDYCSNCSNNFDEENSYVFSIESGGILCKNCFNKMPNLNGKTVSIHPKIVQFLVVLEKSKFNEKTKYDELATEKICITCFNLLKDYITYNSPKKFKTTKTLEFV